jgi:hypothetical protein
MRESQIEKKLADKVKNAGGLSYKFCSPNNPGVPDRIVITPDGRTIFVELKTEVGRIAKIQEWQIKRLKACGCDVRVLKGINEVNDFIREVFPNEI